MAARCAGLRRRGELTRREGPRPAAVRADRSRLSRNPRRAGRQYAVLFTATGGRPSRPDGVRRGRTPQHTRSVVFLSASRQHTAWQPPRILTGCGAPGSSWAAARRWTAGLGLKSPRRGPAAQRAMHDGGAAVLPARNRRAGAPRCRYESQCDAALQMRHTRVVPRGGTSTYRHACLHMERVAAACI